MISADYLHESGFDDDPFADTGDGELFFATPQLTQRLDLLQHLIVYSDLVPVIIGASGSGKTTLLNRLVSVAGPPWRVGVVQAHGEMDVPQFLAKAKRGFDLLGSALSIMDQVNHLKNAAETSCCRSQTPLLVVDEAHLLPPDALNKLMGLAPEMNQVGLRILLLGEPRLAERLSAAAARPSAGKVMHRVDMPVFSESQAAEYLRYRVRRSGLDAAALFPDDVARGLYRRTGGLPGRLNAAARDLLADRLESTRKGSQPVPSLASRFGVLRRGPGLAIEAALLVALSGSFWVAIRGDPGQPAQAIVLSSPPESRQAPKPSYEPTLQESPLVSVEIAALEPLVPFEPPGPATAGPGRISQASTVSYRGYVNSSP